MDSWDSGNTSPQLQLEPPLFLQPLWQDQLPIGRPLKPQQHPQERPPLLPALLQGVLELCGH